MKNVVLYWRVNMNWSNAMEKHVDKIYWHVYDHEDVLKIWRGNELIAEIPSNQFPHIILQMATYLKNKDSKMQ